MKKLFTLACLCILIQNLYAQEKSVFERLFGSDVNDFLTLSINPTNNELEFIIDSHDPRTIHATNNARFHVENSNENRINVFLNFYNPLRVSVKSGMLEIPDPNIVAINTFFGATLPALNQKTEITPSYEKSLFGGSKAEGQSNFFLYQWEYEYERIIDKKRRTKESLIDADIQNNLEKAIPIESFLFGIPVGVNLQKNLNDGIKMHRKKLYEAKTKTEFKLALDSMRTYIGKLRISEGDALKNLEELNKLLIQDFDIKIGKVIQNKHIEKFKIYSTSVAMATNNIAKPIFEQHGVAIKTMENLINNCDTFLLRFEEKNYRHEAALKFSWDKVSMYEYTYTIQSLNENGEAVGQKPKEAKFIIAKKERIAFFPSTGALLTNYNSPIYGLKLNQGIQTIEQIDNARLNGKPVLFLNGVFTRQGSHNFFMLGQIGVTYSENRPIIPIGVGFQIRDKFSITSGGLFGSVKDLPNNLKEGDEIIDDATLQNSLVEKLKVAFYVSINYKLTSK